MSLKLRVKQFFLKKDDGAAAAAGLAAAQRAAEEMETAAERKARMISLWLIHAQMFIYALSFSIVLTGVFPYLLQVRTIFYFECL